MNKQAVNILDLRRTIIYSTKYLFHKRYKFGYLQDVKVIFKFYLFPV